MRGRLFINPRSGSGSPGAEELEAEARARGLDVHVVGEDDDIAALARDTEAEALGMAGGDGSLGLVAAAAIERDLPFVCVPFGTRNHFARDLGLDRDDPVAALDAFEGREQRVDVGRVGEQVFLNHVSLGVYAQLVHRRERRRSRREALARARALWATLRRRDNVIVSVDGDRVSAPVVLVANNHYALDMLSIGERERLDDGLLHLYAPNGLLRSSWDERTGTSFSIDSAGHRIEAAVDGEPAVLDSPLEFRIEPAALRVLLPPG
ncbi:MAG: diacylglycerol/lipid kinase family protein [Gaiellaceae bacterium]